MIAAICIVGRKNAGKTTLIERLLPALAARGHRVATIKHDAHDFEIDVPGKDTWRHREAGSRTTIIASSSKVAMVRLTDREVDIDEMLRLVPHSYDLVLIEGLKRSSLPKVLVRPEPEDELLYASSEILAVVSDGHNGASSSVPRFRLDEMDALAEIIEQRLQGSPRQPWERDLTALLGEASRYHGHLCPGQVLGVRMAIKGCEWLGILDPRSSKRLVTFVEAGRCAADAIQTATGCTIGKRTLKLVDYGKVAATFLDTLTGRAVRVCARESAREAARLFAPGGLDQRLAQLQAYRTMPDEEMFTIQEVRVSISDTELPGRPHRRVLCELCGEAVNDCREVRVNDRTLCLACAAGAYYAPVQAAQPEGVLV